MRQADTSTSHAVGSPRHRVADSPLGPLTLAVNGDGALAAVLVEGQKHAEAIVVGQRDDTVAEDAARQLAACFAGDLTPQPMASFN